MNRKPLSEIILDKYISQNNEASRVIDYDELLNLDSLETYFYDDLPNTEVKGFPVASDFADSAGNQINYEKYCQLDEKEKSKFKLRYHFLPYMHEIYIGTTGSGKTTTCIEPQIRAITSQKNKPNIFVSDPKGEIFLHNVKHLKEQGYNVQVLNFKNVKFSNCWNPLDEIYTKQMKILEIGKGAKIIKSNDFDKKLILAADSKDFKNGYHIVYDNIAFPTYKSFNHYIDGLKHNAHADVTSLVNQLCHQMFPTEENTKDPVWANGAREYFNGLILALLEDAINPKKNFTREMLNIKTINDLYTLTTKYNPQTPFSNPDSALFHKFKEGKSKEALDKIEVVSDTADSTKKGFLSTCQTMIGNWMNGHIFSLTTKTDINLNDSENPIALFIITRDYDKSDNLVAGLFLNWVYRQFLEKAEETERKNGISGGRPIHFLLDEFANIPAIPDFEIKIATSRSRNMWFHLYIQSYEQLNSVYDRNVANIIIDNCNQQTFLGSQSIESKTRFAKECGEKSVRSLRNTMHGSVEDIQTFPVLALSTLNNIEPGWMFTKRIKTDVFKSTFVRSYQCAKENIFKNFEGNKFEQNAPLNLTNPAESIYQYDEVIPERFRHNNEKEFLTLDEMDEDSDDDEIDLNDFIRRK